MAGQMSNVAMRVTSDKNTTQARPGKEGAFVGSTAEPQEGRASSGASGMPGTLKTLSMCHVRLSPGEQAAAGHARSDSSHSPMLTGSSFPQGPAASCSDTYMPTLLCLAQLRLP